MSTNVRRTRERRGLSVRQLSARLAELGYKLLPSGVTNVEARDLAKRRRVDVDDLVALALALRTTPAALLGATVEPGTFVEDGLEPEVAITPGRTLVPPVLEEWVAGVGAPYPYVEEGDDRLIFDASPSRVRRSKRLDERAHPARDAVREVAEVVDSAVEALADRTPGPPGAVSSLRAQIRRRLAAQLVERRDRLDRYLTLLADELLAGAGAETDDDGS